MTTQAHDTPTVPAIRADAQSEYEALMQYDDIAREWLRDVRVQLSHVAAAYCATGDRDACAALRLVSARERQIWLGWFAISEEREAAFRCAYPAADEWEDA